MERDTVEVFPKRWVKLSFYISSPLFFVLGLYIFYKFVIVGETDDLPLLFNISMIFASSVIIIMFPFGIPVMRRFKIRFDSSGIRQKGLITREIPYDNIEKVKVRKGNVEIYDGHILHTITIGDLYTNFGEAVEKLAGHIADRDDIVFKGADRHIESYFGTVAK